MRKLLRMRKLFWNEKDFSSPKKEEKKLKHKLKVFPDCFSSGLLYRYVAWENSDTISLKLCCSLMITFKRADDWKLLKRNLKFRQQRLLWGISCRCSIGKIRRRGKLRSINFFKPRLCIVKVLLLLRFYWVLEGIFAMFWFFQTYSLNLSNFLLQNSLSLIITIVKFNKTLQTSKYKFK